MLLTGGSWIKGMADIKGILNSAIGAAKRRRNLILFFILAHAVFLFFGHWTMYKGIPGVVYLREEQLKLIREAAYLKPLTGVLAESLILKILYTFFFNLLFGAFLSTTLSGLVFFLPYVIAVWRSFIIGVLFYGLEDLTPLKLFIFYTVFILEFGAYSISSAAGTDMGLAILWPARKGTESRKEAFRTAVREMGRLYTLVIILLFVSAVWEISWLEYLGPFIRAGKP